MSRNAILVDVHYCTGCHSCEVACKERLGLGVGKWGIKLLEDGPWQASEDKWELNYVPYLTSLCDMCADRVEEGKLPTCVHHCLGKCMHFGTVEELSKKMETMGDKAILLAH